jgi:hypothetical protein
MVLGRGHRHRQEVYEEVESVWANRKWGRIVTLSAGKELSDILLRAATGRKGQMKSTVLTNMDRLG